VPKILAIFREIYRGDQIALLFKEDTMILFLYTVFPVGGVSSSLFVLGSRFIKRNYVFLYLLRQLRLSKALIWGEMSYRVFDMKNALLNPLRILGLIIVLALISIMVEVLQY
jgi:hypothetical protein